MFNFSVAIDCEIQQTERIIRMIRTYKIRPKKHRFSVMRRKGAKYYRINDKVGSTYNRKYIGKSETEEFNELFQASYNEALLELETDNLKVLEKIKEQYVEPTTETVKERMSKCVRNVKACGVFDDKINELIKWTKEDYEKNTHIYNDKGIYDIDGVRMRSKSECLVSNLFINAGVPKRHDSILTLDNPYGGVDKVSPDFLIRCFDGSYVIHEHVGLLTDEGYFEKFVKKLRLYFYNNYLIGTNLFFSFDDGAGGIDTQTVANTIETIKWRMLQL